MANGFTLNHGKSLQVYCFCVKRQAKNDFLKDVKITVCACPYKIPKLKRGINLKKNKLIFFFKLMR